MTKARIGLIAGTIMAVSLGSLPWKTSAASQDEVSLTGHLRHWAVDDRELSGQWVSRLVTVVTDDQGETHSLEDPDGLLPKSGTGRWVISGRPVGDKLIVTACGKAAESTQALLPGSAFQMAAAVGAQKTLVALLVYADKPQPSLTLDQVREVLLTQQASTDAFMRENSYGLLWLAPDFLDWTTLPGVSTDYAGASNVFESLLIGAIKALESRVNFLDYSRLILVLAHDDGLGICGVGTVGTAQITMPGGRQLVFSVSMVDEECLQASIVAHELGHNLGFWHSASISCLPENFVDPCHSCADSWMEYGDEGDIMGAAQRFHHFSAIWKNRAGWISDTLVQDVVQSGEYWLPQVQLHSPGPKTFRIPLGQDLGDFCYWLEYRGVRGVFDQQDVVQVRARFGESGSIDQASFYNDYTFSPDALRFRGLAAGGSVSGRIVTAPDGLPAANILVALMDAARLPVKVVQTDTSGHYSLEHLPDGYYYLLAASQNHLVCYYPGSSGLSEAEPIDIVNGAAISGIDCTLMQGGTISGRVTLLSDGRPAAETTVTAVSEGRGIGAAKTDARGYYSITRLPEGRYRVMTVNAPDGIDQYFPSGSSAGSAQLVDVTAGAETAGIDLQLPPGGAVSGRIVSPGGDPVANASVHVLQLPARYTNQPAVTHRETTAFRVSRRASTWSLSQQPIIFNATTPIPRPWTEQSRSPSTTRRKPVTSIAG